MFLIYRNCGKTSDSMCSKLLYNVLSRRGHITNKKELLEIIEDLYPELNNKSLETEMDSWVSVTQNNFVELFTKEKNLCYLDEFVKGSIIYIFVYCCHNETAGALFHHGGMYYYHYKLLP